MANVIWKNGTWTYGNWGGKGWSAGKFSLPSEKPDESIGGVDALDRVFKAHDMRSSQILAVHH
jgi:hypothetical protein